MADDDALLAITFHVDDGADMDAALSLLETFYGYFRSVGNFLVVAEMG